MSREKLSLLCFCLSLALGLSLASRSTDYFDKFIENVTQKLAEDKTIDPIELRNYTQSYKDKKFFTTIDATAEFTEGKLTGLSKVESHSECHKPENTKDTCMNCILNFEALETSYEARVKYGILPRVTIHAKGEIKNTLVDIEVTRPVNRNTHVYIRFKKVGTMETTFTGLGPLNSQMKVLENYYKKQVGHEVEDVIMHQFYDALEKAIKEVLKHDN